MKIYSIKSAERGNCSENYVTLEALTFHQINSSEKLSPYKQTLINTDILLENCSSEIGKKIKSQKRD